MTSETVKLEYTGHLGFTFRVTLKVKCTLKYLLNIRLFKNLHGLNFQMELWISHQRTRKFSLAGKLSLDLFGFFFFCCH